VEITTIFIIIAICLTYRFIFRKKYIAWFIFAISVVGLYYYQPVSSIRNYDFWIPSISIFICILAWILVASPEFVQNKNTKITFITIISLFLGFALVRFLPQRKILEVISIPTQIEILIFLIIMISGVFALLKSDPKYYFKLLFVIFLFIFFIFLKNENLALILSRFLRTINDQSLELATSSEIIWIGYSYFTFRLIHVLLDAHKRGKINMDLHEFIGYLFFLPALLAGPIMRREDYQKSLYQKSEDSKYAFMSAFYRIFIGLFQKFILADSLAVISMNNSLVKKISSPVWMWFVVIMYAFRIYFDFSGYTHIAIGIAKIIGINLPENFKQPLRSPNITMFWNNWHITLTQWFRSYYFNPLTRLLRRNFRDLSPDIILAFMQISTMILIGLWHGISWNFTLWGVWIGIGLFLQSKVSNWFIKNNANGNAFWQINSITRILSVVTTFIYVSLGWVWFAMLDISTSTYVFRTLFGLG